MAKKQIKASDLKGLFIYQDKKHGTVYYDVLSRNGYVFTSSNAKYYSLSIAFLPIAIIVFYLLFSAKVSTYLSLIIALASYIIMQLAYRFLFLYKLPCIEKYKIDKKNNIITNLSNNYSVQRLIVLIVMALLLVGVTIAYIIVNKFEGLMLVGMIIIVIVEALLLIASTIALIIKKKQ